MSDSSDSNDAQGMLGKGPMFRQNENADAAFRWEELDQRLLSPKTNDLAEEMHKRTSEAESRIGFDTARSGNSAGYLPRWLDFQEQLTDEWRKGSMQRTAKLGGSRMVRFRQDSSELCGIEPSLI
jgi:hypothetical protein